MDGLAEVVKKELEDSLIRNSEYTPEYKIELIDRQDLGDGTYQLRTVDPITGWELKPFIGYFRIANGKIYKFF